MADREMTNEEAIDILGGIRACYNIFDEYDEPKYAALSKAIFALKAEPTKHGRNIATEYADVDEFICSECGLHLETWVRVEFDEDTDEKTYYEYELQFCPNCGARMDGGKGEQL